MPQRSLIVEATKPTPLRRSPRLRQLKTVLGIQNPTSNNNQVHPISNFSPITSSPSSRSTSRSSCRKNPKSGFPEIFSKDSDKSRVRTRNCEKSEKGLKKSNGGSMNTGKSANGSPRKSRLNSKFEGLEGLRKSPRLCKKVNSVVDLHCSPEKKRSSGNVEMHSVEASPITPVGMGEKKSRFSDLLKCSMSKSKKRVVVQSGVGEVRERRQFKGKESRSDSPKIIICGLASTPEGNHKKNSKAGNSCEVNVRNSERMITRSASKSLREQDDSCRQIVEIRNVARKAASKKTISEAYDASGSLKTLTSQPEKRITRNSAVTSSIRSEEEMGLQGIDENEKENCDCNTQVNCELKQERSDGRALCNSPERENKTHKLIGNKRKRKQAGLQGTDHGWTKEQEVALQRAYFAAKPSPQFWKRVAKLVPGKSAQECFDKVHSDNLTPLSTRRSSRAKKWNLPSDLSISSCNLFKSPETKSKKMRKTKQKSHIARRTVRHLLQKYSKVNQDNESDLFSILEPTVNPSLQVLQKSTIQSTPQHVLGSPGSSSKHKKYASRFRSASKSPLTSPPVLKKVKNMALHEKYIDQLHKREAKRKVQSSRYVKSVPCQKGGEENPAAMKDVIRAAKDALVSDARNAINKFRDSQANIMDSFSDSEEEGLVDEDEDDGVVSYKFLSNTHL